MARCAFLTTDNLEEFFVYDELVKPHLINLGWQVDDVSWLDESIEYNNYDVVVVRSTWDYQAHPEKFLRTLNKIEASSASLQNPLALMQWNLSKKYLKDLQAKGVEILPTVWLQEFDVTAIKAAFTQFNTQELIIKPLISANADFTYRLTESELLVQQTLLQQALAGREIMIQAFEESIVKQGEFSLFYFSGEYSHTINKRPALGDFRVQEEHGGELASVVPTPSMIVLAEKTLNALPTSALYARIDMLNTTKGLAIMEVELIEPSLYFNLNKASSKRFAEALVASL